MLVGTQRGVADSAGFRVPGIVSETAQRRIQFPVCISTNRVPELVTPDEVAPMEPEAF